MAAKIATMTIRKTACISSADAGAAEQALHDRHQHQADDKTDKGNAEQRGDFALAEAAVENLPAQNQRGHGDADEDVAEIAAEEAVAALGFDALGEAVAELGDRLAVRLVDGRDAATAR